MKSEMHSLIPHSAVSGHITIFRIKSEMWSTYVSEVEIDRIPLCDADFQAINMRTMNNICTHKFSP